MSDAGRDGVAEVGTGTVPTGSGTSSSEDSGSCSVLEDSTRWSVIGGWAYGGLISPTTISAGGGVRESSSDDTESSDVPPAPRLGLMRNKLFQMAKLLHFETAS